MNKTTKLIRMNCFGGEIVTLRRDGFRVYKYTDKRASRYITSKMTRVSDNNGNVWFLVEPKS